MTDTFDPSDWKRERLILALLNYRNLYADEAVAHRRAVADKIGLEERLAASEQLRIEAEAECESLQAIIVAKEYESGPAL